MTEVVTDVDPIAVLSVLGIKPAEPPRPVPGGWDTALFRFRTMDGAWQALRVFRSAEETKRARREQISIRAADAAGIPVPRVEATGVWQDLPAVVLSWLPGTTLIDALQRRPWTVLRLGRVFGRMQAAIHSIPAPEELRDPALDNFDGSFVEWVRGLDPALPSRLEDTDLSMGGLIHGDYHPLNILTDGKQITGVIDWPSAGSADSRVDVGHTAVLLDTGPLPPGPLRPLVGMLRSVFRRAWMRGYEEVAGPMMDLAPFMALAGLSWLRDLQWAEDRPGVWDDDLDPVPVRRWTERWKRESGID